MSVEAKRQGDSVLFLGQFLQDAVGQTWGIEPIQESPDGSQFKFTRCRQLELARQAGATQIDICRAHEAYWQAIGDSLEGQPRFHFTQMMKYGAPFCVAAIEPTVRRRASDG